MQNSTFSDNEAGQGGAISIDGSSLEASHGKLSMSANTAADGGAIMSRGHSTVNMPGARIANNIATSGNGGAVMLTDSCDFNASSV